jgi:hypothetical protein
MPPHTKTTPPLPPNQTAIPQNQIPIDLHRPHNNKEYNPHFNLYIAQPRLDFLTFSGDESFNWLRQCEKYFTLESVPIETWVPLATLHYSGTTQTGCKSLRTLANYVHWT